MPLPRRPNADLLRTPGRLRGAMKAALEVIDRIQPDVVVGFGGYVSVPAYLAARKRGLPLVVHEGNALPGIANKLGARFTTHVATSFPDTDLPHAHYIGLPIRRMISTLDRAALPGRGAGVLRPRPRPADPAGDRRVAGRAPAQPVGRRGRRPRSPLPASRCCTSSVPRARPPLRSRRAARRTSWRRSSSRMDLAYAAADAVLCRAGSNTVTEVSGVGLPAIYVPLPIGNGEQAHNARPVVDAGGGLLVADAALTPEWVREHRPDLLTDPERLATMSAAAAARDPARRRRQARRDDPRRARAPARVSERARR